MSEETLKFIHKRDNNRFGASYTSLTVKNSDNIHDTVKTFARFLEAMTYHPATVAQALIEAGEEMQSELKEID